MNLHQAKPQRVESVIINDETEEPSLLNAATGQILITNTVGKRIVELADGNHEVEAIVDALVAEFVGAERETVRSHMTTFLTESTRKGIVRWLPAQ